MANIMNKKTIHYKEIIHKNRTKNIKRF